MTEPGDTPPILARIDLTLTACACGPAAPRIVLPAVLTYVADDPYAVALAIHSPDGQDVVEWYLARDLLTDGLCRPAGAGDVRLRPIDQLIEITLSSPDGAGTLTTPREPVIEFCRRSHALVPAGHETDWIDLDDLAAGLLENGRH